MKRNQLMYSVVFMMVVCFAITTVISLITVHTAITKENKNMATLLANNIYEVIDIELEKHIVAGQTIAYSQDLVDVISHEDEYSDAELEAVMKEMLGRYQNGLGCNTAFVVSEKSKRYYTAEGLNKVVSPDTDDHDVWYSAFLEKNKEYDFNIDVDQVHSNTWTVFINVRLEDEAGNLLGVCGIGTEMSDMQSMLVKMQESYDVKVNIVDSFGNVQVTVDDDAIEKTSKDLKSLDESKGMEYKETANGYILRMYMEDFDWTLIIQRNIDILKIMVQMVAKNFLVMLCLFVILVLIAAYVIHRGSRAMAQNVQLSSFEALGSVYEGMYLIDVQKDTVHEIKNLFDGDNHLFTDPHAFAREMKEAVEFWVEKDQREMVHEFFDVATLEERLDVHENIYSEFCVKQIGWVRARFIDIKHEHNENDDVIFAIEVIDQEKKQEEELKRETETAKAASEAKGLFLANMSHEIRTPINAVLGMDTMILRETKEPHIKEYALNIQNASRTLLSLINDILDISKIESGKMEIVPVEYDFASLVHDVVNMIRVKADAKKLKLFVEVDENLPATLFGDDVRIRQILVNIMNNAVKYTEEGSVTFRISGTAEYGVANLHFSVKDTGIGIKESDKEKLFAKFERIEDERNRNIEGTGLGMSITLQLLNLMGSKLEVESVYGQGSEFYFDLVQDVLNEEPIGDISSRVAKQVVEYTYENDLVAKDARILVVDDNEINRQVFINLLKNMQMNIEEADGGWAALRKINANKYDIIFLDHMMPDMNGIEVVKDVKGRNNHPNTETPMIALTANAISGAKEEYMAAGFNDYLSKPIIPERLDKMIELYLPEEKKQRATAQDENATATEENAEAFSIEQLPSIQGVDWNYANLHFPDGELMVQALQNFAKALPFEADLLKDLFDAIVASPTSEALEQYRIKIHALKSNATMLGMVPFGGMAAVLEQAARDEDVVAVKEMTPHFLVLAKEYTARLAEVTAMNEDDKKELTDVSLVSDYLEQLILTINNFDVHGADAALQSIQEYAYEDDVQKLLDQITVAVGNLDPETVETNCRKMMELLQK